MSKALEDLKQVKKLASVYAGDKYAQALTENIEKDLNQLEELKKENQELRVKGKELLNDFRETLEIAKKYKRVIDWLKNTFEITLDSKLRISDEIDCIQAFPIDIDKNVVVYDLLKEVFGE